MNSFNNEIMDLLEGNTPRQKYQALKALIGQRNELQGTVYFAYVNLKALGEEPSNLQKDICKAIAKTLRGSLSQSQIEMETKFEASQLESK